MTEVIDINHSLLPSDQEDEVTSLSGSELEMEMMWGEGPIAPLRNQSDDLVTENSERNGSSRATTPKKMRNASPLSKSKRLINIDPARSAPYLPNANQLPVGQRGQRRWYNDHHFGNKKAIESLEDLMEHMNLNVEWKSNFQKLAEPENLELWHLFRKSRIIAAPGPNQPKYRRRDNWNDAEEMFARIDRRARTLLLRSFKTFMPFINSVEKLVSHFIQWREIPSEIELHGSFLNLLVKPLHLLPENHSETRMCIPLMDSAFHRLMVHSVCQFYGVSSKTEANRKFNTKIMIIKFSNQKKFKFDEIIENSLCEFIQATRVPKTTMKVEVRQSDETHDHEDGFDIVEFPTM